MASTPLSRIYEKTWSESILFSVLIELTYQCNLDCYFCYNDLGLSGRPLADEQYFRFFDDLAAMGVMNLTFSGGEPLAHPSFFELGGRAKELGFVVRIKSNGHLIRGGRARRIKREIDPFVIDVSLHGADAATHDRQTRVDGSFDRLLANLEGMKRIGLRAKLNSTLTRWNESQIGGMFAIADRFGLEITIDPNVTPRDDGDMTPLEISASRAGLVELQREQQRRVERARAKQRRSVGELDPAGMSGSALPTGSAAAGSIPNCGAGTGGVAVDPYGNVYPCVQWRRPIGNLHHERIGDLWKHSGKLAEIRQINLTAGERKREMSEAGLSISHCMGVSELVTGDPVQADPRRIEQARLRRQIQADAEAGPLRIVY